MRHANNVRKFGREKNQRRALLKGLALSLITEEKIKTTLPKAKELRPYVEKMITQAKKKDLNSTRLLLAKLQNNKIAVKKLTDKIAPAFSDRKGGYTRITKIGARLSDASEMAYIEIIK